MSQIPDLKKLYNLQPGQRAIIEVELLNSHDGIGVVAAICGVSRVQKRSQEEYFRIHSIKKVPTKKMAKLVSYPETAMIPANDNPF